MLMCAVGGASTAIEDPEKGLSVLEKAKEVLANAPPGSDETKMRSKIVEIVRVAIERERAKDEKKSRDFGAAAASDAEKGGGDNSPKDEKHGEMNDLMDTATPKAKMALGGSGPSAARVSQEEHEAPGQKRSWKDGLKAAMDKVRGK